MRSEMKVRRGREKGEIRRDEGGCEAGGCLRWHKSYIFINLFMCSSRRKVLEGNVDWGGESGGKSKERGDEGGSEGDWLRGVMYFFVYLFIYSFRCVLMCPDLVFGS